MPRESERARAAAACASPSNNHMVTETASDGNRSVSWWTVHEFAVPLLESVGSWPMAGTPAWDALDDPDPRKLAALLDAAQHWALHIEIRQDALDAAGQDIWAAADWSAWSDTFRRRQHIDELRRADELRRSA